MPTTSSDLDPARYIRGPILDVAGAIALGIALVTAHSKVAKSLPTQVKRSAKELRQAVVDLQHRWDGQRGAAGTTEEDRRPADQREDRAFSALALRLEGLTQLPPTIDEAARATKLYTRLFPNGLAFLRLPYERQWAECEQRMRDIGDGPVAEEVVELAGEVVLNELRAAHKNYGRALGITAARGAAAVAPKVTEHLRVVQQSIGNYALQLVAAAKADGDLLAVVQTCLRPLDDLRIAEARRGGGSVAVSEPDEEEDTETDATVDPAAVTPTTPIPNLADL